MKISENCVAAIHFTLTHADGELIDSSKDQDPLVYLHGANNIVPGLEQALLGKTVGDSVEVTLDPEDGYGENDPALIQELPLSMFPDVDDVAVGMEFHAETQNGMQVVEVIGIDGDNAIIDGNHPLAGERLHFDVQVTSVRAATEEELEHGHAHNPEGCGHIH